MFAAGPSQQCFKRLLFDAEGPDMKLRKILGALLILVPFAAFTAYMVAESNWLVVAKAWVVTIAICGVILAGVILITSEDK